MKLSFEVYPLRLIHRWAVSSTAAVGGRGVIPTILVRLIGQDGATGSGEAPTTLRYGQPADQITAFLATIDPARLDFHNLDASLDYLQGLNGPGSALSAMEIAMLDGHARRRGVPLHDLFDLRFRENGYATSFSIGIDHPETVREKVLGAAAFPILKLKVGSDWDCELISAVRSAAPEKRLRLDANEAWSRKEDALRALESFASDANIEFVEQPMPASTPVADQRWLKERSPLPLFADESCQTDADADVWAEGFHGVNVKLIKTRGPIGAYRVLLAARKRGLKTMLGCMVETTCGIAAAVHLAGLADHLDLDGHLLISNDPFEGLTVESGSLAFAPRADAHGLRIRRTRDGGLPD